LVELLFQRPANDRNVPFQEIATATRLPLEQVEWLLMRAMSNNLVKGTIDQVDQIVSITWVMPRVLDAAQLAQMSEKLQKWNSSVNETLNFITDQTPELSQ